MKYLLSLVVVVSMVCAFAMPSSAQVSEGPLPAPVWLETTEILANGVHDMEYDEAIEIFNRSDQILYLTDIVLVADIGKTVLEKWPIEAIPAPGDLLVSDSLKPGQRGVILTKYGAAMLDDDLIGANDAVAIYTNKFFDGYGIVNKGMKWSTLLGGKVVETVYAHDSTQFEGMSQQVIYTLDGKAIDFFSTLEDDPHTLGRDVTEDFTIEEIEAVAYLFLESTIKELVAIGISETDATNLVKQRLYYKSLIDAQMMNSLQVSLLIFIDATGGQVVNVDVVVTPKTLNADSLGTAKMMMFMGDEVNAKLDCDLDTGQLMLKTHPADVATGSGNNAIVIKFDRQVVVKYDGVLDFCILCNKMPYCGTGEWNIK